MQGGSKRVPGFAPKQLLGVPWRVALALQADGWWLRRDNIWAKRNPMPESARDRTTSAHEYMFMLAKSARYFYDADATREPAAWERWGDQTVPKHAGTATAAGWIPAASKAAVRDKGWRNGFRGEGVYTGGRSFDNSTATESRVGNDAGGHHARNKRSVWEISADLEQTAAELADVFADAIVTGDRGLADTVWSIATEPYAEAHFATFPTKLVEPCVLAGTSARGVCPDCGAPWERVVDVSYERAHGGTTGRRRDSSEPDGNQRDMIGNAVLNRVASTTGWAPTCGCYDDLYRARSPRPRKSKRWQNHTWWARARARAGDPAWPTVPATVLDPFLGSGTTALVARRLGRASVGVELNPDYARLAERRLQRWWRRAPAAKPAAADDPQLTIDTACSSS